MKIGNSPAWTGEAKSIPKWGLRASRTAGADIDSASGNQGQEGPGDLD